jgi:hypothetical protein
MGLFGSIIGGLVPVLGTVLGAQANKKAIKKGSQAQIAALQSAIDESTRQFNTTRSDFAPYTQAGAGAIGQMGDIAGLHGDPAQASVLDQLRNSPFFQSLFRTGEEAVLQNASATGGLRGGNTQRSLADFGADTFAKTIQQQLANLGGIAGLGSGMASNLGQLGAANSASVGQLMVGQGNARAGSILGRQQVNNDLQSQITKLLMSVIPGAGGLPGLGAGGF